MTPIVPGVPSGVQEFPRASPSGTPSGGGVYLTVYPSSHPNTDTFSINESYNIEIKLSSIAQATG